MARTRRVRVCAGGRVHFGFCNLSLGHERLYGGMGVALDAPRLELTVERAEEIECDDEAVRPYVERAVECLGVPGARVVAESSLPRHAGLGSGTPVALSALTGVGRAYDGDPNARELAPELGRGGRSGVGVATFESGGFVLDAGHPTARFTTARPARGEWRVPAVSARHEMPEEWRFLLVVPEAEAGRSDEAEDESMRAVVERADPEIADRVAGVVTRRLLPAIAEGAVERFGAAVEEVGRLNGAWYADEQGGVYRPPVGSVVAVLADDPAVFGAGQSSWGPTVYGVTDAERAEAARAAGKRALDEADVDGRVRVVRGRNDGAEVVDARND